MQAKPTVCLSICRIQKKSSGGFAEGHRRHFQQGLQGMSTRAKSDKSARFLQGLIPYHRLEAYVERDVVLEEERSATGPVEDVDFDPTSLIHVIRNHQVILDAELAALYEVETKYLNRVAARHADRFPQDFRFQLTLDERDNLRCQIGTSSENRTHGGRRYMPYAYTEQGVAMLSGLLNSEKAVSVSIGIMRAFVEMRRFLANNGALLDRVATIEYRQLEYQKSTEERFEKVFNQLDSAELPAQRIFYKGELFDALSLLSDVIKSAKKEIVLVDGYVDEKTLDILSKKRRGVPCKIVTFSPDALTHVYSEAFKAQYGPLSVVESKEFHDRFLIIDESVVYHIGASIKDAGKKTFAMSVLKDRNIVDGLIGRIATLV